MTTVTLLVKTDLDAKTLTQLVLDLIVGSEPVFVVFRVEDRCADILVIGEKVVVYRKLDSFNDERSVGQIMKNRGRSEVKRVVYDWLSKGL